MPTLKSLNLYDLIDQTRAEENMFDVEFIVLNPDWRAQGSMKEGGSNGNFPVRFFRGCFLHESESDFLKP